MPVGKVVLDTNVVISAFLSSEGAPARIFELFLSKKIINYTSLEIIHELESVLSRKKFSDLILEEDRMFLIDTLRGLSTIITVRGMQSICKDPSDDKFIHCALTARAILISGDSHLLSLSKYKSVEIVSPSEFLRRCS